MKPPRRLTLRAALCHVRQTEITDSLVDLFIQLVLKINTRAERKVDKELNAELIDLDLSIRATVPSPRTAQGEAASIPV